MAGQALTEEGITIRTGTTVLRVQRLDGHVGATLSGQDGTTADIGTRRILVATGRVPNTTELGLDSVGVGVGDRAQIVIDEYQRTPNPRIWAAGDVTGGPQYVYVAAAQGKLAADNAFGQDLNSIDYAALPRVTFTSPAIASVGMTEAQARDAGRTVDARVLRLAHVPRAIVNRDPAVWSNSSPNPAPENCWEPMSSPGVAGRSSPRRSSHYSHNSALASWPSRQSVMPPGGERIVDPADRGGAVPGSFNGQHFDVRAGASLTAVQSSTCSGTVAPRRAMPRSIRRAR